MFLGSLPSQLGNYEQSSLFRRAPVSKGTTTTMNTPRHLFSRSRIANFLSCRNTKSLRVLLSGVVAVAMAFGFSPSTAQGQGSCAGDSNGDSVVNQVDLAMVLNSWGACPSCAGDNNGDGVVNQFDLAIVLNSWGSCPGTITSVTPLQGSILGGTQITINGTTLGGTLAVEVGGVACTSLQVLSTTLVKAVTPAGTAGEVAITVISAAGTGFAPSPYTYVQNSIASVTPNQGGFSGGNAITITGAFLNGATSVRIGGVACTDVVAVNSTTVTAVTPAGSVGSASVEVTGPKGTATAANAFTYFPVIVPVWATLIEPMPDPAVVIDGTLRSAIIASGFAWRIRDNSSNIEMLLVPPGTFQMGCIMGSDSYSCYGNEQPVHTVTLTNAYYLGRYEVTQAQWQAKMGSNPSYFQGQADSPSRPVEQVSWNTFQNFKSATGLRWPTEAEWEFACRAGTTTPFHSGPGFPNGTTNDGLVGTIAWYYLNSGNETHAVGGKAGNALGMHDMLGNVWEWQNDPMGAYSSEAQTNPTGSEGYYTRVLRGGSYNSDTHLARSSYRMSFIPTDETEYVGFRVARTPSYFAPPTISSVSPNVGPTTGGTVITITGTNLTGTSSVTIGGVAATSVSVSSTTVTAVTPEGTIGAKTVSITTPAGTANLTNGFTYPDPGVWFTVLEQNPNPAVVTDVTLRNAITATGYPWRVRDNGTQIEMVLVPGGTFTMGCTASNAYACFDEENPTHSVTITNAFYMGRYEVTQAQWLAKMGSNPSFFQPPNTAMADTSRPVERVPWNTIQGFLTATGMQLPTEAQWEYACRAGTTTAFHGFAGYLSGTNDDDLVRNFAWYSGNNAPLWPPDPQYGTKVVGGKAANGLGLHDMSGNVCEWCGDWYGAYSAGAQTNPTGPATGSYRVLRGGAWNADSNYVRSSNRDGNTPDYTYINVGFRVARAPS